MQSLKQLELNFSIFHIQNFTFDRLLQNSIIIINIRIIKIEKKEKD